jgi:hypothetical protein
MKILRGPVFPQLFHVQDAKPGHRQDFRETVKRAAQMRIGQDGRPIQQLPDIEQFVDHPVFLLVGGSDGHGDRDNAAQNAGPKGWKVVGQAVQL